MDLEVLSSLKDSVLLLKHTKHPLDRNPVLKESLGIPGLFPVPEYGQVPETTYCADYEKAKGYEEPIAAGIKSEGSSLLDNGVTDPLIAFLKDVEQDLNAWEYECSVDVVHRSDGLVRFLRKANPAMEINKRQNWFERILKEDCSLRDLASEDEIPVQHTPKTAKSLAPIVDVFTEKQFPSARATWYLKLMVLRKEWKDSLKRPRSMQSGKGPNSGMSGRSAPDLVLEKHMNQDSLRKEWTKQVVDYMVGKMWDVADYKDGGGGTRRPSLALSSNSSSSKSWATIQRCVVRRDRLAQWESAFRYFCWQYENGLLHKQMFLEKLLAMMLRMRDPEGIVTKLGRRQPLPLALCFVVVTKVCADNLRQLLWVGSSTKQSLFYDPDFSRLVEALQLGLEFAKTVAPEQVEHWGRMYRASPEERAAFKAARTSERIAEAESAQSNPYNEHPALCVEAHKLLDSHSSSRTTQLGCSASVAVPTHKTKGSSHLMFAKTLGISDRRRPSTSSSNKSEPSGKGASILDAWHLLEVVPDTASLAHLLSGARRVRRSPRFR